MTTPVRPPIKGDLQTFNGLFWAPTSPEDVPTLIGPTGPSGPTGPTGADFAPAGDLSGTVFAQKVIGLQNHSIADVQLGDGYLLSYNLSEDKWYPVPKESIIGGIPNKLVVGKAGEIDFTSISEAILYATAQGASPTNPYEVIVGPGTYTEPKMTIIDGISVSNEHCINMGATIIVAENPNDDLFICNGGYLAGVMISGVTDSSHCLIRCTNPLSTVTLYGIGIGKCSNGIIVSGGIAAVSEITVDIKALNQEITKAITVTGSSSIFGLMGGKFFVPGPLALLYSINPIQTCISINDGAQAFITSTVFAVGSKDNTADVIFADGGSIVSIAATEFFNCNIATHIGSSGSNTQIILQACSFSGNYFNGKDDSSTGSIFTNLSVDTTHYTGVSGSILQGLIQYKDEKKIRLVGELGYRYSNGSDLSLSKYFNEHSSSGIISGGVITKSTGLFVNVSSGSGWIKRETPYNDVFDVEWITTNNLAVLPNQTNYIVYDSASDLVISQTTSPSSIQIQLGKVITNATEIRFIHEARLILNSFESSLNDYLITTRKFALNSGMLLVAGTSSKKITIGSGSYYIGIDLISYLGSTVDGYFSYFHGLGGVSEISDINQIDDMQYDLLGSLTTLHDGYYKNDSVYITSDGRISIIYGDEQFETLSEAQVGDISAIPNFIVDSAFIIAKLVIKKGAGIVDILDLRPQPAKNLIGVSTSGIIDHSLLSNLDKNTHPQYMLVTGASAMSGDLDLGGNDINNIATVDGVDVSAHASRHNPGGLDPLSTAVPVAVLAGASPSIGSTSSYSLSNHQHGIAIATPSTIGTANYSGTSSSTVASDHIHAHGSQTDGYMHALAVAGVSHGFISSMSQSKLDNIPTEIVKSILMWGNGTITTNATTAYLTPCFETEIAGSSPIQYRIPYAGTLKNMYVVHNAGAGNGNTITYTLRVNSVASALTAGLASTGTEASDLTHTVSVARGDRLDIAVTKTGINTSPSNITVTMVLV